jgi:alkylated DNA repair dioxygenase AlkB
MPASKILIVVACLLLLSSVKSLQATKRLVTNLPYCSTPKDVLELGKQLTPALDTTGQISSLMLSRLAKQCIAIDNTSTDLSSIALDIDVVNVLESCLAASDGSNMDAIVEGTKAYSILSRILSKYNSLSPLQANGVHSYWTCEAENSIERLQPHHLSGLQWAYDTLAVATGASPKKLSLPPTIERAYNQLEIPFRIYPGLLLFSSASSADETMNQSSFGSYSVAQLSSEINFRTDHIRTTTSQEIVPERRKTAWQGDEHVGPFYYSGKSMERDEWSPSVRLIRDQLLKCTGQYYDCCLLNLYPDGGSGMLYHIDPDQGTLWDYDTAVVSIGATRKFAFREIPKDKRSSQPHNFVVMHGDVTYMFDDCQERFQHTVKNSDLKSEIAPRISLVFKRTFSSSSTEMQTKSKMYD